MAPYKKYVAGFGLVYIFFWFGDTRDKIITLVKSKLCHKFYDICNEFLYLSLTNIYIYIYIYIYI